MGRQTTILQVFLASPSELNDERIALESVVKEVNQTLSESTGAYLELIKWETHAVPGFGSDPQAVINEQIGDSYDIFIGMLSTKFGSPTPRAASGTEEEFERAYDRFTKNPNELRIMFYFKDPELRASEIDLAEYKKVKDFKNKLGEKGLYATFNTTDEFVTMVRLHLARQLQEWAEKKWGSQMTTETTPMTASATQLEKTPTDDEELGFLDYVEMGNDSLRNGTASLGRITQAMSDLGRKATESTPKLIAANQQGDVAKQKQIINNTARDMEEFGLRIDAELPIFSNSYATGIDAISKSATIWAADFNLDDKTPIQTVHDNLESMLAASRTAREAMLSMQQTVSAYPRVTSEFNRGKRHVVESLAGLDRAMSSSQNLTIEVLRELKRILGFLDEE